MPVPSAWTGSLLEWAKAVAGWKLIPVPRSLKGRLAEWLNFSGAARSRPVPGATTTLVADVRLGECRRKVHAGASRTRGADRGDGHRFLVGGSANGDLVAHCETVHASRTLISVAPALASAGEIRLVRLRADVRDRDGLDPMADAVDIQPDLVAGRDIGDRRHLDVGRAGGRVRRQEGLRARLADRGDRGHLVLLHGSCDGGVGGAVAEGDLLAGREAGHAR